MYWPWLRLAAAVVGLSGVVAGFIVNIDRAARYGHDLGLVLANYFSLFTILSTILSIIALTTAAVWSLRNRGSSPEPFGIALGIALVTGPLIVLGVLFNVLLRGLPSEVALTDPPPIAFLDSWATESLHVVLPLYFLLDLLFAARRRGLPWWTLAVLVGYPLAWAAYTMIRGELVPDPSGATDWWYPYPFLDPHGPGGWGSALTYIGGIAAGFVVVGAIIIAIGRLRERRALARENSAPVVESQRV